MYSYIGKCTNLFDDYGDSNCDLFSDVTDFDQSLGSASHTDDGEGSEDIKQISKEMFDAAVPNKSMLPKSHDFEYWYNKDRDYYVAYDIDRDIHYIFA